jgi:hypothetical protein
MIKIFVSGPYSKGDILHNVTSAMDISNDLINAGFAPYCPHLTHFLNLNNYQPYEKWLQLDLEYLNVCDALLRFPGDSLGADKEVVFAKNKNIPIFYSLSELLNHYNMKLS